MKVIVGDISLRLNFIKNNATNKDKNAQNSIMFDVCESTMVTLRHCWELCCLERRRFICKVLLYATPAASGAAGCRAGSALL
jgi:hypothetical protein